MKTNNNGRFNINLLNHDHHNRNACFCRSMFSNSLIPQIRITPSTATLIDNIMTFLVNKSTSRNIVVCLRIVWKLQIVQLELNDQIMPWRSDGKRSLQSNVGDKHYIRWIQHNHKTATELLGNISK